MADILISKFTTQIPRVGATPATPGFAESEGQDPVAPSGTPQVYTPVTIGSPANGLSISGTQVLTIGLASTSATGALSSTDWNTFNNKLNLTSPITGYTVGANTALANTDTILQAFGKVQGQINARILGTIASGQVAFGTGVNTVGGSARFTYGDNSQFLVNNTVSASGAIAIGINFTPTLTATANNDVLVGLNISPTFNLGGFSNLSLNAFRISVASNNLFLGRSEGVQIIGNQAGHSPALFLTATSTGGRNYRLASWQNGVTGYFTIRDDGAGVDVFNIDASRRVGILTTSPTNTLDVNGTARIRTISNLGSAATSVLVPSATGVVSLRTLAELSADMSSVLFTSQTLTSSQKNQARVNIGSTSATPQVIATAGAINDLSTTSNHLVFTGASVVLSGIVAGLDGEEFTILNASGTNLELLSESALSVAGNRFASGVIVPNLSIVRIKYRTTTQRWVLENVGTNDARYLRKDVFDTKLGGLEVIGSTTNSLDAKPFDNAGSRTSFRALDFSGNVKLQAGNGPNIIASSDSPVTGGIYNWRALTNTESGSEYSWAWTQLNGTFLFAIRNLYLEVFKSMRLTLRSSASDRAIRRDELYLNYSQTVATAGTINNLAINADCKLLILTGATDLTGVVPVDDTRLLRIEARSASRIIRNESASSTAANRFSIGADLTINAGEVYQFIYTDSRWRRVL